MQELQHITNIMTGYLSLTVLAILMSLFINNAVCAPQYKRNDPWIKHEGVRSKSNSVIKSLGIKKLDLGYATPIVVQSNYMYATNSQNIGKKNFPALKTSSQNYILKDYPDTVANNQIGGNYGPKESFTPKVVNRRTEYSVNRDDYDTLSDSASQPLNMQKHQSNYKQKLADDNNINNVETSNGQPNTGNDQMKKTYNSNMEYLKENRLVKKKMKKDNLSSKSDSDNYENSSLIPAYVDQTNTKQNAQQNISLKKKINPQDIVDETISQTGKKQVISKKKEYQPKPVELKLTSSESDQESSSEESLDENSQDVKVYDNVNNVPDLPNIIKKNLQELDPGSYKFNYTVHYTGIINILPKDGEFKKDSNENLDEIGNIL